MRAILPALGMLTLVHILCILPQQSKAADRDVNDYTSLVNALTAASNGDVINFKAHIVVTSTVTVSKSLTFQGNGYTVTVPVTGLSETGIYNLLPSTFNVFTLSAGVTVTFNRLTIKGGSTAASGAGVRIATTSTAYFNYCTISNARCTVGGGGIYNQGTCFLYKTLLTRNVAQYGGGMLNAAGKTFMEYCTINENRTLAVDGGGGIENNGGGSLFVNNSTFSNNQSGAGGAINNYGAKAIVCNSSFTGNIAFNATPLRGGAIYQDNLFTVTNTLTLVNCLFAYNYYAPTGAYAASSYTLDDIRAIRGTVDMHYCTYMATSASSGIFSLVLGNLSHPLAANGSDNDLFTGGSLSTPFDGTGVIQGTGQVFQPLLVNIGGQRIPSLKSGSFALGKGCEVGFSNGNGTPVIGYKNMTTSAWTDLTGSGASGFAITDDITTFTRAASPAIGAVERTVDNYIILKVINSANGTVSGASIYGEAYPSGTSITLTALANAGYALNNWTYNLGGSGTVNGNPLTITPVANTTLTPNFTSSSNYTITYLGNGNTGGTVPAIGTFANGNNATLASNTGALVKTGFTFNGWNTSDFGAGTSYTVGSTYTGNTNLVLYASWSSLGGVLHVDLTNFSAALSRDHNTVLVKWQTATEQNNAYFEVQRAEDCGSDWKVMARIAGSGNSTTTQTYSYTDNDPYTGQACYRLKQVDQDGKEKYYPVAKVNRSVSTSVLQVYPNPAINTLTIVAENIDPKTIRIYNQSGGDVTARCMVQVVSKRECRLTVTSLAPGIYFVHSNNGETRFIKK